MYTPVLRDPPQHPGNAKAIASVTRDFRGRQIVAVKGHNEKLEVSRSYLVLFEGI